MEKLAGVLGQTNFGPLDWGILVLYLAGTLVFGLMARKFIVNMDNYVVAGRGIRTALGVATLTGTEIGLVTVMYGAQKGFTGGFAAFHIGLIAGIVAFLVGLSGFILGPLRDQHALTIPDYYRKRFGKRTQVLGGIMLAAGGILNMSMFLKAGAIFLQTVMGLQTENALLALMVFLVAAELLYTMVGGMIAVVLTDYLQFVVLSVGMLLGTWLAIEYVGWGHTFDVIAQKKGEEGFNPLLAESTFGVDYVLWMVFLGINNCAIWPTSVARALASENVWVVKKQFMWASISYAIRMIIPYFWGIAAFVFIIESPHLNAIFFPDGKPSADVDSLYAMPIFFSVVLPTGMIGLLTAGMIAAMMSTDSGYFLTWSSVLTNDVVVPLTGDKLSQRARVRLTRIFVLLIGVAIFTMSYVYPLRQDLWDFLTVSGAIYFTGAFAVLIGGLYWKRASSTGAVLAMIAGGFSVLGLGTVQQWLFGGLLGYSEERVTEMMALFASQRVGLGTVLAAVIAMVVGSLLFPDKATPASAKG
jgi:SSS family solute:Na+ symporter